ncbi:MAG: YggS family pyridoxal phosphate-dependent enzyme [Candidatus Omnitrophica bacterium]|nr:YggS family pyridoxal phosphate-dependent enzyme [Candidatus Omnitrophota bacterium]
MIRDNLNSVRDKIQKAALKAGRNAGDIVLVCVTKETDIAGMREAINGGITDIGENTIQAAAEKYKLLGPNSVRWHFIGHLQTNKTKDAVKMFDLIHSVDSLRLAEAIQKEAEKIGKMQSVLAEVNISGEKSKYGLAPEDTADIVAAISGMKNLMLLGLMTIAPYSDNPENARPYFRELKNMRDELSSHNCDNVDIRHLSMGMSGDFEIAVEEGADIVRIGSAIFRP